MVPYIVMVIAQFIADMDLPILQQVEADQPLLTL